MPRKNRSDYIFDNCVVHARLQINNGEFHFKKTSHFNLWRKITLRYLKKYPTVKLTGYQWMSNHCHLTLEADIALDLSRFMHDMNWRFAFEFKKLSQTRWSSYHFYAYGKEDPLVTPFRTYGLFGVKKRMRMLQFRRFVETMMSHEEKTWKKQLINPTIKIKNNTFINYSIKTGMG